MNVTIRQRARANNRTSLYLDVYYGKGLSKRVTIGRIYNNPKGKFEKLYNKNIQAKAEDMKIEILLGKSPYSFFKNSDRISREASFTEYFKKKAEVMKYRGQCQFYGSYLQFIKFSKEKNILFSDLTASYIEDYQYFLYHRGRSKRNTPLSRTTSTSYFEKFCATIKFAQKEGVIFKTELALVSKEKHIQPKREYLTEIEIKRLSTIKTNHKILLNAFIFCCYTGLRFKDMKSLQKKDVVQVNENEYELVLVMNKTQDVVSVPLHPQALNILNSSQTNLPTDRFFKDLKYSNEMNKRLREIALQADINKHIFFYTSRHSFASNLLNKGVDIMVIKDLLGHKNLVTTQIYAKMSSGKKHNDVKLLDSL